VNTSQQLQSYFDRIALSFDAIYTGQKGFIGRRWDRLTRRNIQDRLNHTLTAAAPLAGKRVLDVGCGSGRYAVELLARGAKEVVGLDLSARMIELARGVAHQARVSPHCSFLQQDILKYSAAEPFDVVIAQGFFDYVPDPQPVFARLRMLCRGTLVASFPWKYAVRALPRRLWLASRGCPVRFFTRGQILSLCQGAGFRWKSVERKGPIYLLVAERGPH
jgi:2-polyprenyl-3-methyl-5-hydroxy-6-metoxy-1,4-benzoquinol methylase